MLCPSNETADEAQATTAERDIPNADLHHFVGSQIPRPNQSNNHQATAPPLATSGENLQQL